MKTNLITREGYLQLQQEHDHLWNVKRPEVTKIVSWAATVSYTHLTLPTICSV